MSEYKLTTDHFAIMGSSHGITLKTNQSFVPYDINVVPYNEFEISDEIKKVTYTGHLLEPFIVSPGAELRGLSNEGKIDFATNNNTIYYFTNAGTISTLTNGSGNIGTITDIHGTTTITNVSGSIVIPSKSNLTGSIIFGGGDTSSAVTLKYDSDKDCMVFTYD